MIQVKVFKNTNLKKHTEERGAFLKTIDHPLYELVEIDSRVLNKKDCLLYVTFVIYRI